MKKMRMMMALFCAAALSICGCTKTIIYECPNDNSENTGTDNSGNNNENNGSSNVEKVTINVVYDWEDAPEAYPEGMYIFFYNEDDSYYDRWDFPTPKAAGTHDQGGQIRLDPGMYSVITYNNDTETIKFSGTNQFSTHTAYTGAYNTSMCNTVINNPSMMWGVTALDVVINEDSISYTTARASGNIIVKSADADMTLTLYPHELVATYTYDVINVHNLKYAYLMSGTLSGMASNLNLSSDELGPETYPVAFDSKLTREGTDEDGTISGSFYTFANVGAVNTMVFYAILTNGDNWYNIVDVTDQVQTAADPIHVHILIDGMELPSI